MFRERNVNQLFRKSAIAFGLAAMLAGNAAAEFPERNIEVVFPWPPGVTLASSQVMAEALGEELGVEVTVISTPGGTGTKAMQTALERPADGYTIFDGWVAPLVVQSVMGNIDADHTDFIALYALAAVPNSIIVRTDDDRFPDFPAFVQYMKDHPGELRYTSGPFGNLPHIAIANMHQATDTVAQHVPYGELEEAMKDLRGGVLDYMAGNPGFYRANKEHARVLVAFSEMDSVAQIFDGAPKISEYGIDFPLTGLGPMGWSWWLVHKDTPPDRVEALRKAMATAIQKQNVKDYFDKIGRVLLAYPPDQYMEVVQSVRDQLSTVTQAVDWEAKKLESVQ